MIKIDYYALDDMQMILSLLLLLFILYFSFLTSLKIKFNPSEELTKLSSEINYNFFFLIKTLLLNEEFWPILTSLSRARYYNFYPVLMATMEQLQCLLTLEIIQSPNFPLNDVLSADILSSPKLVPCFNLFSDDFFWNKLKMTPLESSQYKASKWDLTKHDLFIKSAYLKPRIKTNWYSWCDDPTLSPSYIESSMTWKVVNFNCMRALPEFISLILLANLSPTEDLLNFNFHSNSMLFDLFNYIVYKPSNEDLEFGISQTMKIVSISTYLLVFPEPHELFIKARLNLLNYYENLKIYRKNFPLRSELKRFIKNILAPSYEREPLGQIYSLLAKLLEACKGEVRGPWILNIFIIWNHFRDNNLSMIFEYLDEFVEVFLDPVSFTTVPDICLFLGMLNSYFPADVTGNHSVTDRIFGKILLKNHLLSKEVMSECPAEIPKRKRTSDVVFPLQFRLQRLFKSVRYIESFDAPSIYVCFNNPPERSCYFIFSDIDDFSEIEGVKYLPMNTKVKIKTLFVEENENLPKMLQLFFQNLMLSSHWFVHSFGTSTDRAIILPSLTLPPHFMEYIGVLIGKAVISNVQIPFIIDKRYFELPDAFENIYEASTTQSITLLIRAMYPNLNDYASNRQVFRIASILDLSAGRVLQCISKDYTIKMLSLQEPMVIANNPYNMHRIILMGSERLRLGLNRVLQTEFLTTTQLYNLIFK